jgi:hypothetical protein
LVQSVAAGLSVIYLSLTDRLLPHGANLMSDKTEYTPPKVWTWNKESGGPLRQYQPADRRADAREVAAGRQASDPALFARHAERREGSR